jgi:polyribonucleotide nucleotidyltransferase
MANIVEQSLCNSVELLGEMVDTQRLEIQSYKEQIERLHKNLQQAFVREHLLEKDLRFYKNMVDILKDKLLQVGIAPTTFRS